MLALLVWVNPLPSWAQNVQIPAQFNPGLLSTPAGQIQDPEHPFGKQESGSPRSDDEVHLDVPMQKPAIRQESPPFLVRHITLEGCTLLTEAEAQKMLAPYEGRDQTLERLSGLVESLTDFYRKKGYLTTEAYLPPQDLKNGELIIRIQEGLVGQIAIEGNRFYNTRVIGRNLTQKPGQLLNFRKLERDLNSTNRFNDGYKVKAFLSAGQKPGETNLKLKVAERQPLQISPTFDNQGRYTIGLYRAGVEVRNDSLLTLGDQFRVRWLRANGLQMASGSYSLPLNRFGTELNSNFGYSHVNIDLRLQNQPLITGDSYTYGLSLTQPLDKNRTWTLDGGVLWQRTSSSYESQLVRGSIQEVHALQTGLNFDHADRWGRTFNRVQNTFGIRGAGSNTSFWKLENYFNRVVVLPKNNLLLIRGYAQWTPDALPSIQQFQLGGANSVRGFTEGVLIGDRGFNVGIEHRFPIPGLHYVSPWLSQRVQGAWFYDYGRVWRDSSSRYFNRQTAYLPQYTLLQGLGVGVRAQLSRYLQGFVDVGFGLGNRSGIEPKVQPTARVHIGVRSDLFPSDYRMRNQKLHIYREPRAISQSGNSAVN